MLIIKPTSDTLTEAVPSDMPRDKALETITELVWDNNVHAERDHEDTKIRVARIAEELYHETTNAHRWDRVTKRLARYNEASGTVRRNDILREGDRLDRAELIDRLERDIEKQESRIAQARKNIDRIKDSFYRECLAELDWETRNK